jgi:hypothetical protein
MSHAWREFTRTLSPVFRPKQSAHAPLVLERNQMLFNCGPSPILRRHILIIVAGRLISEILF